MTSHCFGCESAASATAKVHFPSLKEAYFFGETSGAADFINYVKLNWDCPKDWPYEIYLREINWETGDFGDWYLVESGTRTRITFSV